MLTIRLTLMGSLNPAVLPNEAGSGDPSLQRRAGQLADEQSPGPTRPTGSASGGGLMLVKEKRGGERGVA
jgi:hypothetical protein